MQTKTFLFQVPVLAAVHPSPDNPEYNAAELLQNVMRDAFTASSFLKMAHIGRDGECTGKGCIFCTLLDAKMKFAQDLETSTKYIGPA